MSSFVEVQSVEFPVHATTEGQVSDERTRPTMLTSWKAIARHFDRDARTVQRWEKGEGLPVYRHPHRLKNSVYAFPDELDAWWRKRGATLTAGHLSPLRSDSTSESSSESESDSTLPLADSQSSFERPLPDRSVGARRVRRALVSVLIVSLTSTVVLIVRAIGPSEGAPTGARVLAVVDGGRTSGSLSGGPMADINGDGLDDFVFAAGRAKEVYVVFGGSPPKSGAIADAANVTIRAALNGQVTASLIDDADGDQLGDILVSAFLDEPDSFRATGHTYLVRGRRDWPSSLQLPDAADVTFALSEERDIRMGACTPGHQMDFDGDGIGDLVFGGADYSPPGRASAGAAFVVFGRRQWPTVVHVDRDADVTIHGSRTGEGLAYGCDTGDFNGDGRLDLALVAREETLWYMLGARGRYYVFFGRDSWPRTLDSAHDADIHVDGLRPNAVLSPPLLADVNGDGFDDLVAASSGTSGDPPKSGEIAIFTGRARSTPDPQPISSADVVLTHDDPAAGLGAAVTTGDFDDDGRDDLVIGTAGSGHVYLLFGRREWPRRVRFDDLAAHDIFPGGPSTSGDGIHAGDVDGDGLSELLLTSPAARVGSGTSPGRVWIVKPHIEIALDVRPGAEPNVVFVPGVLVARVDGRRMPPHDPIDPTTVRLAGVAPSQHVWRDFDGDGVDDLQLQFDTTAMRMTPATLRLAVTARTRRGVLVAGVDSVTVMPGR